MTHFLYKRWFLVGTKINAICALRKLFFEIFSVEMLHEKKRQKKHEKNRKIYRTTIIGIIEFVFLYLIIFSNKDLQFSPNTYINNKLLDIM